MIAGASGLLGDALSTALAERGYRVQHLVRAKSVSGGADPGSGRIKTHDALASGARYERLLWDPSCGSVADSHLAGADAVVTLNGAVGSGRQYWPWISLRDHVSAMVELINNESITGPVNLVAPEQVTANDIGRAVSKALRRPFLMPASAPVLRVVLGRAAAESLLLSDTKIVPEVLLRAGFVFQDTRTAAVIARELAG